MRPNTLRSMHLRQLPCRQSRSLTAAFELYNAGFKKVRVLDGGIGGYVKGGFELEA